MPDLAEIHMFHAQATEACASVDLMLKFHMQAGSHASPVKLHIHAMSMWHQT